MKRKGLDRYAFALILLAASLFSLTPARADQAQAQLGTVFFHLTGHATSMNTTVGSLGSVTLDLAGGSLDDGQGGLMIQNLTGALQIGSANYSISGGDCKSDVLGNFVMLAESSSGELLLQGTIQHNSTVTTDPTLSRLSSLAYLALSGIMRLTDTASWSVMNGELSQNVTSTLENMASVNPNVNSTSLTQSESSSSSVANFTLQMQVSSENATLTASNITSLGQSVPSPTLPEQKNTTMTTTQLDNYTITVYVSITVTNSTITQTTTTTVANTTITQVSSITVSSTTVIVTNSTNSGH
jgi:hypothetical protein